MTRARKWWLGGLVLALAAAGVFNVFVMTVGHMMDPRWGSPGDRVLLCSLLAVAGFSAAGLWLVFRGARFRWLVCVLVPLVAAIIAPNIYEAQEIWRRQTDHQTVLRDLDARTVAKIQERTRDIEARMAENRPYQGEDARLFMEFVLAADNSSAGGVNRSPESIAMLRRVIEMKILDPNTIVKQPLRADRGPEPLFINFYRNVRQAPERSVLGRDWTILKILVAGGADLSLPGAAPLAADLRKTEVPLYSGLYVDLK